MTQTPLQLPSPHLPIQPVATDWLATRNIQLAVLRADLADPLLSGNKLFKLKYNLLEAARLGHTRLLSFGGVWSNHLHALAAAGQRFGFSTIGVVRGEPESAANACLQDVIAMGMQLQFVSRAEYQYKHSPEFLARLKQQVGDFYMVPEGGANLAGIRGCQEMLPEGVDAKFTHIALACGTGTTMAGIVTSTTVPVIGIQVLKGKAYLQAEVAGMLSRYLLLPTASWTVHDEFHAGGYARTNQELLAFIERFAAATGVPVEPVYSGKLFLAISRLAAADYFPQNSRILAVHGGGMQGARGLCK